MTKREAAPHIDAEAEFFLSLPMEQRRRLPFAPPCISQATIYRVAEKQRQEQEQSKPAGPAASPPAPKQP